MAIPVKKASLAPRSARKVPMLDQAPLGHLQALVLKTLDDLGKDASGLLALETLRERSGRYIDHAAVYGAISKLQKPGAGWDKQGKPEAYIEFVEKRKTAGGPPVHIYRVTPAGRSALKQTLEHHEAVAAFLRD